MNKFISRKFIMATAIFVALILATTGVIDQGTEVQVGEALALGVYIIVQGLIDVKS